MPTENSQLMQCMEVWGGNSQADNSVSMSGLDAWVYSRPFKSADAGGDVYYLSSCATGRVARLLVADVSGHGASVQQTAIGLRDLMRRYVNHLDQRQFVRSMNEQFAELSQNGCFATAVVTTFFGPTNHLALCNAGHPTPLIYRARTRTWGLLEHNGTSSGALANIPFGIESIVEYEQTDVQLEVGDLVLCYSDSLIESRGADGELIGVNGLLKIVGELKLNDLATVVPRLLATIGALAPGNLEGDDVTVLLFRPNGSSAMVSVRDRLLAPFRVLAGVIGALVGGKPLPLPELSLPNIGGAMVNSLNRLWRGERASHLLR